MLMKVSLTSWNLIDQVLLSVINNSVLVYMNDIIMLSNSVENHISHLAQIFILLHKTGLTVKLEKYTF